MMKYQKSMMKLMERIIFSKNGKNIEILIGEAKTGRNSSFEALNFLEEIGLIKIENLGNQKIVSLVKDNYSLQFKYYLDSVEFKSLDPFKKLIIHLFVSSLFDNKKINSALLFGSALKNKNFNDIDFLLLGDKLSLEDIKSLEEIKKRIERFFGVIINIHKDSFNFDNLFNGMVIYQSSYVLEYNKSQKQYFEFLDSAFEAIVGKDKNLLYNSLINLAYVYCFSKEFFPKTKVDALEFLNQKYKIKNLVELKKTGIEIGKEIFR